MHQNVHNFKLLASHIEELKKVESFFQPGVCFQIAPSLDKCKECWKRSDKRSRQRRGEVDCRFYQFRKLRYNGEDLEVAGFSNPETDPVEVDRNVWLGNAEKLRFKLSPLNARLILSHVGDELCQLIEKEKLEKMEYLQSDIIKPIIWKRLIDGVLEICDLCATTLFNYHFICTRCGLSLCTDCVNESSDNEFKISCSMKDSVSHQFSDLSLTQIIVSDCMEKLQKSFHDTCHLWGIPHTCDLMKTKPDVDKATVNLIRNLLNEMETGKSVANRELPHKYATIEVDIRKLKLEAPKVAENIDADFDVYFNKFRKSPNHQQHCKPVKNSYKDGVDNVLSISRSLCQATSNIFYPDVPHRWLCENKLLRLTDPLNPGNEAIFHEQWQRGQPVLISGVLDKLQSELWVPEAFSAEFGHERSDFINCMTGNLVRNREISTFWDGFENVEKRLMDHEGQPMLLKLKDWPPDSDFKNIMPSRFEDIMKNLPVNSYTNRTGDLNIVKYLPNCFLHPDLGPKGKISHL